MIVARRAAPTILLAGLVSLTAGRWWALTVVAVGAVWTLREIPRRAGPVVVAQGARDFTDAERRIIFDRDPEHRCVYCQRPTHYASDFGPGHRCNVDYQADHVVAWDDGGPTILANGVISCRIGNQSKGARSAAEFIAAGGCLAAEAAAARRAVA